MSSSITYRSPARRPSPNRPPSQTTTAYLTFPVTHVVSGLYRRLTLPSPSPPTSRSQNQSHNHTMSSLHSQDNIYTPPHRTQSPFQPPPLTPLTLHGILATTPFPALILSPTLAEEIRLLVPPRLQLVTDWTLAYSVEQDGVSLATLYKKCSEYKNGHNGFVLVVRDGMGGTFGAFLTDPPHPSAHYYGTGECFLWRASVLPMAGILGSLPPPPSADTTNLQRSTTLASPVLQTKRGVRGGVGGTSTPERLRFKAFPYSGVNDYMMFCEADYLSVGGGDGKYGLWLDSVLERGVSSRCETFGNEGLSEEGEKFDILGVEVWYLGT